MELKVLNRFALGDTIFSTEWESDDWEITVQARFTGSSVDGTILLHATRWMLRVSREGYSSPILPRTEPVRFEIRLSPVSESNIATATWRIGPNDDDIAYRYYAIGDNGELLQVEPPAVKTKANSNEIGFRPAPEKTAL